MNRGLIQCLIDLINFEVRKNTKNPRNNYSQRKVDNVEEDRSSITSIKNKGDIVNAYIASIKNKYDTVNKVDESRTNSVSNRPNKFRS